MMEAEPNEDQAECPHGVHESPWIMLLPLVVLAILSIVGGWVGIPAALGGNNGMERFLDPVFASNTTGEAAATVGHGLELALAFISVLAALAGFYFAYVSYYKKPGTASTLAARNPTAYSLVKNKYLVDEFYGAYLITPLLMFTRGILELMVELGLVNGSAAAAGATTRGFAWIARKQISGNIRSYAGWLAIGAAAVITAMIFGDALKALL